jgi:hypothetical protein
VAIDYKNKYLYINSLKKEIIVTENELYKKWGILISPMPIINFTDTTKCTWVVSYIKRNKKADSVGIKLWDKLQTVDNISIEHFSLLVGKNLLNKAKKLTFQGEEGSVKMLKE